MTRFEAGVVFSRCKSRTGQRPSFLRPLFRLFLACCLSAFFCLAGAYAQSPAPSTADDQMGTQPYQSYHGGDIDSVGLTTGTLSLHFPFLAYPQRGKLSFSFDLMYNNQPQHPGYHCGPSVLGKPPVCVWAWGFTFDTSPLPLEKGDVFVGWGQQVALTGQGTCPKSPCGTGTPPYPYYYANWSLQTADGSKHVLGNLGTLSWNYDTNIGYLEDQSGPFETLDATGWRVNQALDVTSPFSALGGSFLGATPTSVIGPDGVTYGTQVQDPNGNLITPNSTNTSFTDSLGRQIPAPPTANSTSNTSTSVCPVLGAPDPPVAFAVSWTPPEYNGGSLGYTFCYATIAINAPPPSGGIILSGGGAASSASKTLLQSIVLPNGQNWKFEYNDPGDGSTYNNAPINYGTLTRVTLPTGGTLSYTYTSVPPESTVCQQGGRWVISRTKNANDGTGSHRWTYTYNSGNTVVTDPLLNDVKHIFGYLAGCQQYETQTQYYQGSYTSGTLLKTVNTTYSGSTESENTWSTQVTAPINLVPTSVTTVWQNGQTSEVTKSYDSGYSYIDYYGSTTDLSGKPNVGIYGRVVSEQATDYGNGAAGPVLRTTNTSYAWQSNSNYLSNNLLDLPSQVATFAGTGSSGACGANGAVACTTYGYDESGLQSSGIGTSDQHANGESHPGNQTSVHRWLNGSTVGQGPCTGTVSNGYLISSKVYFDTGEVDTSTDPCAYLTTYQYSPTYYYALPTTVTNALGQITTYTYDPDTSLVLTMKDPNGQTTGLQTAYTYDVMRRLTEINYPDGGQTTACYSDIGGTCTKSGPPYEAVVTTAIASSPTLNKVSTTVFDGLGRVSQTQLNSDPSGPTYTLTTYDAVGRKSQVYNPTRCSTITSNCENETTWGYTTYIYDALSRACVIVQPDGTVVSVCPTTAPAGDVFTSYAAFPCTTVTDEAGKSRKSCVDGLGRMTGVWEDPSNLNYPTTYKYDALNNLLSVTQNGNNSASARVRTFTYDSLSRLACAANPEVQAATCPPSVGTYPAGAITYKYDNDGNLASKTAPSPNQPRTGTATVTTSYTYDTLNRLTAKSYNDTYSSNPATPTVTYGYDEVDLSCPTPVGLAGTYATNGIGRRTAMCYAAGSESWAYDPMGRVVTESDLFIWLVPPYAADVVTINGVPTLSEDTNYDYYLNGDLAEVNYPGPKGPPDYVFYTDENAAGQVTTAGDIYYTVLNDATYTPAGQLASAEVGWTDGGSNPNLISNTYNKRLQPVQISATSGGTGAAILNLTYNFNLGNGDNGNVIQVANGKDSTRTQNFTYDTLNRIQTAYTNGTNWGESYTIDPWANLTNIGSYTGKTQPETLNCATANTSNQLNTCYQYDAAGNRTDNGTFVYDAENRLIATAGTSYIYDGDGQRIEKCTEATNAQGPQPGICSTSATGMFYWHSVDGGTLAESDLGGNWTAVYGLIRGLIGSRVDLPANVVHYYFQDHLKSTDIVTAANGNILKESDYLPYGGEIVISGSDPNRYKFTGKERDGESGLDDFGARYYASSSGRFMTPDWAAKPLTVPYATFGDPQTLNLYSYVENAPLNRIDPDGHIFGNPDIVELEWTQGQEHDHSCTNSTCGDTAPPAQAQNTQTQEPSFTQTLKDSFWGMADALAGKEVGPGTPGEKDAASAMAVPVVGMATEGAAAEGAAVSVYTKAETAYVGITKSLATREAQHGEKLVEVVGGLTRQQAKGVEQAIIEQKGLAKNGGALTNKINSIARTNPIYEKAVQFGRQLLQSIGFQ
jgi:RHS repeat-associated protein